MIQKRFENRLNQDNIKFNTLNPVWDNEKEDALNVFEMIRLLNELNNENHQLKRQIGNLEHTRDFCADVCADCERLEKENEQLKQFKEQVFNIINKKLQDNERLDGVDTAMYYANRQTLNELKKELIE